jgi:hypothetical protein
VLSQPCQTVCEALKLFKKRAICPEIPSQHFPYDIGIVVVEVYLFNIVIVIKVHVKSLPVKIAKPCVLVAQLQLQEQFTPDRSDGSVL